jgi:hypothetical protein
LTAAVVWNWEPRASVRIRPSAWSVAAAAATAGLTVLNPAAGAVATAALLAVATREAFTLRRRLRAAVAESTRGAS